MAMKPTVSNNALYDTPEWKMGDTTQKQWARIQNGVDGCVALPVYGFGGPSNNVKAPMVLTPAGWRIAPDILVMHPGKGMRWDEIKGKSQPTWRKYAPGPRWEHGCDYSAATEYRDVQDCTGVAVYLIIHEVRSPQDPQADGRLEAGSEWFFITLADAFDKGEHRKAWPGGKARPDDCGRNGEGGLLWSRDDMTPCAKVTTTP